MTHTVTPGDVVQVDPGHDQWFGGCLLVVEEIKPWGVQGYVSVPSPGGPGRAYYRCPNGQFAFVGRAVWFPEDVAGKVAGEEVASV